MPVKQILIFFPLFSICVEEISRALDVSRDISVKIEFIIC